MADVKGNQAAMVGSNKNPPELPFPEDSSLNYACPTKATIRRPQGVKTMEEWDSQIFPEGKHSGETFKMVHDQDLKYRSFMMNHPNLTNPWALSFQNYVRAMSLTSPQQMPCKPLTRGESSSKATTGTVSNPTPPWHHEVSGLEWDLMTEGVELSPPPKRSLSPEVAEASEMALVKDTEKEQRLITNIAILQRELDLMRKNTDI